MQTNIAQSYKAKASVQAAEEILRKCVHCGFCLATCPTYNILGDELDSPRGRIYQIKQVLEGEQATPVTQLHLDRCLTCRNCETTCPSGVQYSQLLDVGRAVVEEQVPRSIKAQVMRWGVKAVLPHPGRIGPLVRAGQLFKKILPDQIASSIPDRRETGMVPGNQHPRQMLALPGCVQPSMSPGVNAAAARVLDRLGISLISANSGCCGAINHHLNDHAGGMDFMRGNIDAWWPAIEAGAEAIVMTASGCGAMVKDYGHLLSDDPDYAEKARRVSELTKDISEVLHNENLQQLKLDPAVVADQYQQIAFHPPCTLQHGQQLAGRTEAVLSQLGFGLLPVDDVQECCGSAGTYSIFQPAISKTLKAKKLANLHRSKPDYIATANIGCSLHLQSATETPVVHWVELVDRALV